VVTCFWSVFGLLEERVAGSSRRLGFWFYFGYITGILSASVYVYIWGMCGWAQTIGSIGEAGGGFLFVLIWGAVGGWP
jgi:hypothetical protein